MTFGDARVKASFTAARKVRVILGHPVIMKKPRNNKNRGFCWFLLFLGFCNFLVGSCLISVFQKIKSLVRVLIRILGIPFSGYFFVHRNIIRK
jgi:hypothetical protein